MNQAENQIVLGIRQQDAQVLLNYVTSRVETELKLMQILQALKPIAPVEEKLKVVPKEQRDVGKGG